MSAVEHWPLFGLRVRTPRVELCYPDDEQIAEIASRAARDGVHDPAFMPFTIEWTDVPPPLQQRLTMQHQWSVRANWTPHDWTCNFAVLVDGRIVGSQSAAAKDFAALRSPLTGSYLFAPEQGRGIGIEMRSAVLHLLFAGLGADYAHSAAWSDNAASLGVTRRLGYEYQGTRRMLSRGAARDHLDFRLTREVWERTRRDDIVIEGLPQCLDLFGAAAVREPGGDPRPTSEI